MEFDVVITQNNIKISLHLHLLSIDTMKFESFALAHLFDGELEDEYISYTVQTKTVHQHIEVALSGSNRGDQLFELLARSKALAQQETE